MCEKHDHAAEAPDHSHDHGHSHGDSHGHSHGSANADSETSAECPVMAGSFADKAEAEQQGLVRDYKGTRYYLCCAGCGPLFDADPEKYALAN